MGAIRTMYLEGLEKLRYAMSPWMIHRTADETEMQACLLVLLTQF